MVKYRNKIVWLANLMVTKLHHKYALSLDEARGIDTIQGLQRRWKANGGAYNKKLPISYDFMRISEGWNEVTEAGMYALESKWANFHVRVTNDKFIFILVANATKREALRIEVDVEDKVQVCIFDCEELRSSFIHLDLLWKIDEEVFNSVIAAEIEQVVSNSTAGAALGCEVLFLARKEWDYWESKRRSNVATMVAVTS